MRPGNKPGQELCHVLFHVERPPDEKRLIPIAGDLVNRVSADRARFQMIQDFEFLVQIKLPVKQFN